jgi:hypothetical protein
MTRSRRSSSSNRRSTSRRSVPVSDASLVRLPRVRSAQKRIEAGFYDRTEIRDRLADAVLKVILRG